MSRLTASLVAVVLVAGASTALAQSMPTTQPNYLQIYREEVKLGHSADHVKVEAGWLAAVRTGEEPVHLHRARVDDRAAGGVVRQPLRIAEGDGRQPNPREGANPRGVAGAAVEGRCRAHQREPLDPGDGAEGPEFRPVPRDGEAALLRDARSSVSGPGTNAGSRRRRRPTARPPSAGRPRAVSASTRSWRGCRARRTSSSVR